MRLKWSSLSSVPNRNNSDSGTAEQGHFRETVLLHPATRLTSAELDEGTATT